MLLHPSDRRLNAFADHELWKGTSRRVATHLQKCSRCRAIVSRTRDLGREARGLKAPRLSADLRARVLNGLAAREPVIVPVADPSRPTLAWRRLLWLGAGAAVLVVGLRFFLFGGELHSTASDLVFEPERPEAGQVLTVTYYATGRFADVPRGRLRARYRRSGDPEYGYDLPSLESGRLERASHGVYRGRVVVPPEVVYAVFAVEDESGEILDSRGHLGWELLMHSDRRPTYQALLQRSREASGRDVGVALAAATDASELYPDSLEIWVVRSAYELQVLGRAAFDSLRATHLSRVRAFDRRLRDQPVLAPDAFEAMYFYAVTWGVMDVADFWRSRVLREASRSRVGAVLRAADIVMDVATDPERTLTRLETLLGEAEAGRLTIASVALRVAQMHRIAGASLRWASRVMAAEPWRRPRILDQLAELPVLRDTVLALFAQERARLARVDDQRRPLFRSAARQRAVNEDATRDLFASMARLLLERGDTAEAAAHVDSAMLGGWDLSRFRVGLATRLAAGDTAGSASLLARVAVDPVTAGPEVEVRGRGLIGSDAWAVERARAFSDMLEETLLEASPRIIRDSVRVMLRDHTTMDLRALLRDQVSVVAFWHPFCRPCVAELRALHDLVNRVEPTPAFMIVSQRPLLESDWTRLTQSGLERFVVVDAQRDAMEAFGLWGTTGVFVVDQQLVVQYHRSTYEDVPRQVIALNSLRPVTAL